MKKVKLLYQAIDADENNVALFESEFDLINADRMSPQEMQDAVDIERAITIERIQDAYQSVQPDDTGKAEEILAARGIVRRFVEEVYVHT